ncbi:hypothetical protein E2562_011434 [Oryza meyeriana var. granulata]|uniref:Uncharacterized protein n=1 Tax=Oryza meyeriana var. granulata TaxID=110450 RepID=A0A6G1D203_9ORYZ|nr:hypothetical protein E2562_011434 [Oryza meyeriana var. granulata]
MKLFVMYMNRINASMEIDAPNVFKGISSWKETCNSPVGGLFQDWEYGLSESDADGSCMSASGEMRLRGTHR